LAGRLGGDVEAGRDLLVRQAEDEQADDVELAIGEPQRARRGAMKHGLLRDEK
jgi:hypothetical protein